MLHHKAFVKKTKKGGVVKVVREHYLRDDVASGSPLDPACPPGAAVLSADAPYYTVIDANVGLRQGDLLAHPAVNDLIIPGTALEEVRHRDAAAAARLRGVAALPGKRAVVFANEHARATWVGEAAAGETPNDRNDRAVRAVAAFYANAAAPGVGVVLLTDDAACRAAAAADPACARVTPLSSRAYAARLAEAAGLPELADLVAACGDGGGGAAEEVEGTTTARGGGPPPSKRAARPRLFPDHLPLATITAGLASGRLHQGVFRAARGGGGGGGGRGARASAPDAWVSSASAGTEVLIPGGAGPAAAVPANRAMDGDVVAVELVPEGEWVRPSARLRGGRGGSGGPAPPPAVRAEGEGGGGGEEEDGDDATTAAALAAATVAGASIPLFADGDEEAATDAAAAAGADAGAAPPPNGRVVGILRRAWRARGYPGSLLPPARPPRPGAPSRVLFAPSDARLPLIAIETRQAGVLAGRRIVVALDGWAADSPLPHGHYTRALGPAGDAAAETAAILLDADIRCDPFSPAVLACLPRLPWAVSEGDVGAAAGRLDLRAVCTFSVDPPGCTDIDDALHWRPAPGVAPGDPFPFELGVHIADVSHFVKPGTPLDEEAALRGTSTYLVDRRLDMLPKPLTEDICSLRAGVDRLTFSCVWPRVSARGEALGPPVFTKAVIRSRAALTYEEAQARLDDARLGDEVSTSLRGLAGAAAGMRARRAAAGALQLASPEIKFRIDSETLADSEVGQYQVREANRMVEEAMLAANCAAAATALEAFPAAALLRRHPAPAPAQFGPLVAAAEAAGFPMATATSAALAASLDGAVREGDPYLNTLVRILATRCLCPAAYFASGDKAPPERAHYGLAAPLYTHFTSPIRRYADVVVHRLLGAAIGAGPPPPGAGDRKANAAAADACNARHRGAQLAGRASVELHTLLYLAAKTGVELGGGGDGGARARGATPAPSSDPAPPRGFLLEEGRVVRVRADGVVAFIPKYGLEGPAFYAEADAGALAEWGVADTAGAVAGGKDWVLSGGGTAASPPPGADPSSPPPPVAVRVFDRVAIRVGVDAGGAARRARVVLRLAPLAELAQAGGGGE